MGCSASVPRSTEVAESKLIKRRAVKAITHGERWRSCISEFLDTLEKSGFIGALWAEDEHDPVFSNVFKTFSLNLTELSVVSRTFLSTLDDHLTLLTDLLALQREHHDAIKRCADSHRLLHILTKKPAQVHAKSGLHFRFSKRRRDSIISPDTDESADTLDVNIDLRAEARAQADVKESIKAVKTRRDRLEKTITLKVPSSIVELLAAHGAMWGKAGEVFKRMCEAGVSMLGGRIRRCRFGEIKARRGRM
ncbi:hypothetical protein BC829DRAFT_224486 [Chytridium lagenaria]|nr:hypothetical protein BC829DRAFT_224486 [Chytridium lagenaria]